jgi:hypothetical protein
MAALPEGKTTTTSFQSLEEEHMKKLAVLAVAAMLVFSVAGQAAAFFEDLHLIRTIYDTTSSTEIGSDLGLKAFKTASAYSSNQQVGDLIARSSFVGGLADLYVAYYAIGPTADQDVWATGFVNDGDGLQLGNRKFGTIESATLAVQNYYGAGGESSFTGLKSLGYYNNLSLVERGYFADTMSGSDYWEVDLSLADLSTIRYIDQLLYFFETPNTTSFGVEVATIRTYLDDGVDNIFGTADDQIGTVINPSAVPIPGSVLLLASGLLGLFGFRRKRS